MSVTNSSRYLAGLCVAALGLCTGAWLVLTPFAFGYPDRGRAAVTALATGGGLAVVCGVALACWAVLWRRKLRADGVLAARQSRRSRRSARRQERAERLVAASRQRELDTAPDPAQVLTDLRSLLTPLLTEGGVTLVPPPASEAEPLPEEPVTEMTEEPVTEEPVQVPGHLRDTRSAAFFTPRPADGLLRGAELLMVGTGEEEAW
ncbi:MAG TPA: hypothetical protein VFB06_09935 [Streptosporangiaceae bacterium]|nr:hypothetical protein [Streptosporangiaceae bacterium]